jgi:gluconokinase
MSTEASLLRSDTPPRIVLMGVSGCGKTAVGHALAAATGARFIDGDSLHPLANIAKMSRGEPLDDDDRWPWLGAVGKVLATPPGPTIVGCSALKRAYRDRIRAAAGGDVAFVHLSGSRSLIAARMGARPDHFMPPSLLDSQFAALEAPTADEDAITIDVDRPLADIVSLIIGAFGEKAA